MDFNNSQLSLLQTQVFELINEVRRLSYQLSEYKRELGNLEKEVKILKEGGNI